jgi:hypothetical protein
MRHQHPAPPVPVPYDAPPAPTLAVDDTIKGRHEDVTGSAVDRWATRTNEARLLSPRHHVRAEKGEAGAV